MNGSNREAGRELDALVAEKVMGWRIERTAQRGELVCAGGGGYFDEWYPSAYMVDAWRVVERVQELQPGWRFCLLGGDVSYASGRAANGEWVVDRTRKRGFGWHAEFFGHIDPEQNYGTRWGSARAATPAHAICLAALAAVDASNAENARTSTASVPNVTNP